MQNSKTPTVGSAHTSTQGSGLTGSSSKNSSLASLSSELATCNAPQRCTDDKTNKRDKADKANKGNKIDKRTQSDKADKETKGDKSDKNDNVRPSTAAFEQAVNDLEPEIKSAVLDFVQALMQQGDKQVALKISKYFCCYEGGYGQGDVFLGIKVPALRAFTKIYAKTPIASFDALHCLMRHPYHDARFAALLLLTNSIAPALKLLTTGYSQSVLYQQALQQVQNSVDFYLKHSMGINNWDLVDVSAPHITGAYLQLLNSEQQLIFLNPLLDSQDDWEKRIGIVSNLPLIKRGNFLLLNEAYRFFKSPNDLIHKALGWMLREVGKCEESALTQFLDRYTPYMPRTTLRYSIERLTPEQRRHYMTIPRVPHFTLDELSKLNPNK